MNETPVISFITVNYNGLDDTCELIESIHKMVHSVTYEIIVVDNASRQDEAAVIKARYPMVTALRSPENLGFAGGNNLGIKIARGKYMFFINNDTYLETDGMQALIDRLESDPDVAGVSPKIRFAFPPQNIQYAGYTELTKITIRNRSIGMGCPDDGSFDTPHTTPYLHGAAMLIKRKVIDSLGGMPDFYFLYYEELAWSYQMTIEYYTLWYEPACTVFHKESQSTGQESPLRTFYLTRNRLLFAWRTRENWRFLSALYQIAVAAPKSSLVYLLKGRIDLAGAVWKGVYAFIMLPEKRR